MPAGALHKSKPWGSKMGGKARTCIPIRLD